MHPVRSFKATGLLQAAASGTHPHRDQAAVSKGCKGYRHNAVSKVLHGYRPTASSSLGHTSTPRSVCESRSQGFLCCLDGPIQTPPDAAFAASLVRHYVLDAQNWNSMGSLLESCALCWKASGGCWQTASPSSTVAAHARAC
eukprot:1159486-Pelagomonas_calceolata.AAC.3